MNITYAQYHGNDLEDKFVVENFNLPEKGTFVDIGAGPNGIQGSNSYFFEMNGWDGVVVDGDPRTYQELKKNRKNAVNAVVSNIVNEVSYYMSEKTSDISGLMNYKDNSDRSIKVKPTTLQSILDEHKIEKIDLLTIDTEGTETDVLKSFDIDKHRPTVVIIEFITQGLPNMNAGEYLQSKGYEFVARVGPNLIFHDKSNN